MIKNILVICLNRQDLKRQFNKQIILNDNLVNIISARDSIVTKKFIYQFVTLYEHSYNSPYFDDFFISNLAKNNDARLRQVLNLLNIELKPK